MVAGAPITIRESTNLRHAAIAFASTLAALFASTAHSWGDEGHRITGHIANTALTAKTREKLRALFGNDDLSLIATWMDDERERLEKQLPGSSRWHYENRAACSPTFNASTPNQDTCPRGQCITRQLARLQAQLSDTRSTREQYATAVRMLVHLIGDLHQPLHLTDNHDRGGNEVLVYIGTERKSRRLHEAWDTRFIRMNVHRRDNPSFSLKLVHQYPSEIENWQQGTVSTWANETYAIGKQSAYLPLPNFACGSHSSDTIQLPDEYVKHARQIVNEQLVKAGLRIAMVLNEAIGEER